jgi:hypothetical protein
MMHIYNKWSILTYAKIKSLKSNWIKKSLTTWLICINCDVNIWCGFLLPAKRRCRFRISLRNPSRGKLTRSSTKAYANYSVVIGGFERPRTRFPNCSQSPNMFDWIYVCAACGLIHFTDIVIIKIISDDVINVLSGITLHKNKILINNICSWNHLTF